MTVSAPISLHYGEDSFFSQFLARNVTSKRCTATTFREYFASFKLRDVGRCVLLEREKNIVCDYFEKGNFEGTIAFVLN